MVAAVNNGPIYTSMDAGTTWTSNSVPRLPWTSVTSSADGSKFAAASGGSRSSGPIYTLRTIPAPQLNLASSSNKLAVLWIVPSTNFVLQQNLDLTTTNWVVLTNTPVLNLTNLQNEVTLSPTNSSGFFRLITQ